MGQISKYIFIVLASMFSLTACEKDGANNIREDKNLILELNNKATDTIKIDSHDYFLDAYLWRDFMPISPPNGKSLASINWLICSDSTSIPENIIMTQQYVILNDSIWIADYENGSSQTTSYKIEKISHDGPKWGPGTYVDIISKITNIKTNLNYYLKLDRVYIGRTD
jgi:uncharacterized protein YcfL